MEDFELPSGEVVQVRALTGFEFMLGRKMGGGDELVTGAVFLGVAMLGADIKAAEAAGIAWMHAHSAGDLSAVNERINQISGLAEGAPKRRVDRDGGRRDD